VAGVSLPPSCRVRHGLKAEQRRSGGSSVRERILCVRDGAILTSALERPEKLSVWRAARRAQSSRSTRPDRRARSWNAATAMSSKSASSSESHDSRGAGAGSTCTWRRMPADHTAGSGTTPSASGAAPPPAGAWAPAEVADEVRTVIRKPPPLRLARADSHGSGIACGAPVQAGTGTPSRKMLTRDAPPGGIKEPSMSKTRTSGSLTVASGAVTVRSIPRS
jgi:hypothetical protein